jgi:hypothetical protein
LLLIVIKATVKVASSLISRLRQIDANECEIKRKEMHNTNRLAEAATSPAQ